MPIEQMSKLKAHIWKTLHFIQKHHFLNDQIHMVQDLLLTGQYQHHGFGVEWVGCQFGSLQKIIDWWQVFEQFGKMQGVSQ